MFTKKPMSVSYRGRSMSVSDAARLAGCNHKVVYRYLGKHGNLDGFDRRKDCFPIRVDFNGELLTLREISNRIDAPVSSLRDFYRRHNTLEGFRTGRKGRPLPHLERFYHTLDNTIPLDRCIAAAGYRSIKQFCDANELQPSLVGCWRKGKIYNMWDMRYFKPDATLLDEMTNFRRGISTPLYRIMLGTGCLEWELFPDIFTEDYYTSLWKDAYQPLPVLDDALPVERLERRRVVRSVLRTLPDRLREVVELSFGIGPTREELTYDAIGQRLGLTRARVRQLLNKAIKALLNPFRLRKLAEVSPFPALEPPKRTTYETMVEIYKMKGLPRGRERA